MSTNYRYPIPAQKPGSTDSEKSPAAQTAALRAELLGRLLGAQTEIKAQLAELRHNGADSALIAQCSGQIAELLALQSSLVGATAQTLGGLRKEVGAAVVTAQGVSQQVRAASASSATEATLQVAASSAATKREVTSLQTDLFERRMFDPYLTFGSTEDEEAYRRREAETRRYIEAQLKLQSPEGNLNAAGASMGQMLDAQAHGAGGSPEFAPRWNRLVEATKRQHAAMRAAGQSTEEFDRNLVASVRQYLKNKGLTPAEIEAALASSADPLDAVAPYLKTEQDAQGLGRSIKRAALGAISAGVPVHATTSTVTLDDQAGRAPSIDDVMAKFQAAGVVASATTVTPEHGVEQRPASSEGKVLR